MSSDDPSRDKARETVLNHSILLHDYVRQIQGTDNLPEDDLRPVLLGLFGEVGSIMSVAKKVRREGEVYAGFQQAIEEEFGDALWYLAAVCRRLGIGVDEIIADTANADGYNKTIAATDLPGAPVSYAASAADLPVLLDAFLNLGEAASALLGIKRLNGEARQALHTFSDRYLQALQVARVRFSEIVRMNIVKARGRFLDPDLSSLPTFDSGFLDEERLPLHFEIKITQRKSGQSYLQWNGVFIGDPLTDNILDRDGYRFHDVFHFAHAAILHWSPTFRALVKQKRKSDPQVDEAQDSGRAIVIEEGLTAWIFSHAKQLNFFDGQDRISFDLLKGVQQFVNGYEVEKCPLKLWERTILDGYKVFRQVRDRNGGIVVGDREARAITYRSIEEGAR